MKTGRKGYLLSHKSIKINKNKLRANYSKQREQTKQQTTKIRIIIRYFMTNGNQNGNEYA